MEGKMDTWTMKGKFVWWGIKLWYIGMKSLNLNETETPHRLIKITNFTDNVSCYRLNT